MTDNRNTILAVILSGLVLIAWQYFYNMPQMERQRAQTQAQAELAKPSPQTAPGSTTPGSTTPAPGSAPSATTPAGQPGAAAPVVSRDAAIAGLAPHQDRDAAGFRQHRAEGRTHRRPVAGAIPRHRRSEVARDRAVLAFGHGASLLCGVRLGRGRGLDGAAARPRYGVAAGGFRRAVAEQPGDAEIRQWRRPHLPPHHCDRRPLSLHRQGRRHQRRQCAGHALSVRPDLAPRHAGGLGLLHPA